MNRPTSIRIGGYDYSILWVDGNWTSSTCKYGECDFVNCVIRINGTLPNQRIADTFMHELTHAVVDVFGMSHDKEYSCEWLAEAMGKCLPMLWRDNPDAFAWWNELVNSNTGSPL